MPDAAEPLVLVGPPRQVRGEFHVQNPTERKIVVRQPSTEGRGGGRRRGKAAAAAAKASAAALPETLALRRIVVRAGQSRPVPCRSRSIRARLLARTRPSSTSTASSDRSSCTSLKTWSCRSRRDEIVLPGRPGEKFEKQVVFTNEGNVPVTVKPLGADRARGRSGALPGAARRAGRRRPTP